MTFYRRSIDDFKLIYALNRGEFAYLRDPHELMRRALAFDTEALPAFSQETQSSFDFDYLDSVIAWLKPVPRRLTLQKLMSSLAHGTKSNIELFERLMLFTQTVSGNFMSRQPVHQRPNGAIVSDPILLLDMHEMRCRHVARLVCDLALAHGWSARLVQLGGHVSAEVEIDGRWRVADADVFGGGVIPRLPNGDYGSIAEFSMHPDWLDKPFSYVDGTLMMPAYRKIPLAGNLPSSNNEKGSSDRPSNIGACNTQSTPPNINQSDEVDAPLIYDAICAKCPDDGQMVLPKLMSSPVNGYA